MKTNPARPTDIKSERALKKNKLTFGGKYQAQKRMDLIGA